MKEKRKKKKGSKGLISVFYRYVTILFDDNFLQTDWPLQQKVFSRQEGFEINSYQVRLFHYIFRFLYYLIFDFLIMIINIVKLQRIVKLKMMILLKI